jgi:hypothetical protein
MLERDYSDVSAICATVYPSELPYTCQKLAAHHRVFPEGQLVVQHDATGAVAGAHFTLLGRALTVTARELVRARSLWCMVGGSRMPGARPRPRPSST